MDRNGLARPVACLTTTLLLVAACAGASAAPSGVATANRNAAPSAPPGAPTSGRELIDPSDMYAGAARYGDLVFTAGFLGLDPGDEFEADVNDALDQLETALESAGAGLDTLLKVNVYLTDWDNWETFNSIYHDRIEAHGLPPRTTVEVSRLGGYAPIEIAAIAHVRAPAP